MSGGMSAVVFCAHVYLVKEVVAVGARRGPNRFTRGIPSWDSVGEGVVLHVE